MKKLAIILSLFFAMNQDLNAQAQYEISADPKHPELKIFKGIINRYLLENESTFSWMRNSKIGYNPDTATIGAFERSKGKVQFVVFGGTWCEDTQSILPKFYSLLDKSTLPDNMVTLFGVDRNKTTLASMTQAFNIKNVPTIIVMKDGVEKGRVVEYGKTGKWDKELAEILNSL